MHQLSPYHNNTNLSMEVMRINKMIIEGGLSGSVEKFSDQEYVEEREQRRVFILMTGVNYYSFIVNFIYTHFFPNRVEN